MMTVLHAAAELDAALAKSHEHPIVLFKHSATCPFSARAQEQVALAKHDTDVYVHVVQYGKDLSDAIAEKTGVEHRSPQAIIVDKGEAVWHGWRDEITREALVERAEAPQH